MPAIRELFFRRTGQQAESTPPAPRPEIINEEIHPLHLYPGFNTFVEEWNRHATTLARKGLQLDIQSSQKELDKLPNQSSFLQSEIEILKAERRQQQEIFEAKQDEPKKEKFSPLKRANRRLRRAREKLDRISHQEQQIRQFAEARLKAAIASLVDLDDEFAFRLDENEIRFYVAERLRKDTEAIDVFLLRYCARKGLRGQRQELELEDINYGFFALLRCYTNTVEEVGHEELRASTNEATTRQLRIAKHSYGRAKHGS